jgi:type II secretory pathway pseudopilin PulG
VNLAAQKPRPPGPSLGFTLTEMAIALMVVVLFLGGMLTPLARQTESAQIAETQRAMDLTIESLIGFAITNGRLPCPDTNNDGEENMVAGAVNDNVPVVGQSRQDFSCAAVEGTVPFAVLGSAASDKWGNRFRYRVTHTFARYIADYDALGGATGGGTVIALSTFSLASTRDINVQTRGDDLTTVGTTETKFSLSLASTVPAVVISHGKNGFGAQPISGGVRGPAPANSDELLNGDATNAKKRLRAVTPYAADCNDTDETKAFCEFDDLVSWVPAHVLFGRMVSAGKLP